MTVVAIHQPNYAPWLGHFYKLARADIFVFLDDAQFSKQSFINRVRILGPNGPRWLSQPVKVSLGQTIQDARLANPEWARSHLDTLRGSYRDADRFRSVWRDVEALYTDLPGADLATVNRALVERIAARLGLRTEFRSSSGIETGAARGDDRLVTIVDSLAPGGTYLSGKGGAGYQDPAKFAAAGLTLAYTDFTHPHYAQGGAAFEAGLSVLDAVFHLGWEAAAKLLQP